LEPILNDDNREESETPKWLISALNENEWRKGKFCCPGCNGKVGSFNFIKPQKCACGRRQSPPVYLYKSRIDICSPANSVTTTTANRIDDVHQRDHFAVLKKSAFDDDEWMVEFDSKPSNIIFNSPPLLSKTTSFKTHRKSQSWHASGSAVSGWLTSTLSDMSSQLDIAATETKQALIGTLDLASSAVAAPVSSAIKKGHRKTQSWSGSIKTTLSSLLGGLFSTNREPLSEARAGAVSTLPAGPLAEESERSISDNGTSALVDNETQCVVQSPETEICGALTGGSTRASRRKKRKSVQTSQQRSRATN